MHSPQQNAKLAFSAMTLTLLLAGCHHAPRQQAYQPPPPEPAPVERRSPPPAVAPVAPAMPSDLADPEGPPDSTEIGVASWYNMGHATRHTADGSLYDANQPSAAHRTYPLGTTLRVTNLATGQSTVVRVTDRGPFVPGRILDLSFGAAKQIGLYRAGIAKVKVEAYLPPNADPNGRWCVQTGSFPDEAAALDLKAALQQRYHGAKVISFHSSTGWWVRADPSTHSRTDASAMLKWIGKPGEQSLPYLVRVD